MIKLNKTPEPAILIENGERWLKGLKDKMASGEPLTNAEKSRYRHPEIKAALKVETHGKCAYCESKLLHITYGDVEHISPKSQDIDSIFKWSNLTLACDACNTNKGDSSDIVDPYQDEPDLYFRFLGPMVYANPNRAKGVMTHTILKLNRLELIEGRIRRLKAISSILSTIEAVDNSDLKDTLIKDLFDNEASDENEYAAVVRSFLAVVGPKSQNPSAQSVQDET